MSERALDGLFLARHGQTPWVAEPHFQGQTAVPLDATGRRQAQALARAAAGHGFVALWCSPLRRARETATIVGAALGLEPRPDARFAETDTGDWTGRSFAEVQAADPARFARFAAVDPAFRFPGGESYVEQGARVAEGLRDVHARGPLPALIVCHRGTIRLALAWAREAPLRADDVEPGSLVDLAAAAREAG